MQSIEADNFGPDSYWTDSYGTNSYRADRNGSGKCSRHRFSFRSLLIGCLTLTWLNLNVSMLFAQDELTADEDTEDLSVGDDVVLEELNDLETIKEDISDEDFFKELEQELESDIAADAPTPQEKKEKKPTTPISAEKPQIQSEDETFEVGPAEQELLDVASKVSGKIAPEEWQSIRDGSSVTQYQVQPGDWLFKISKKLFGTGFYYPKIWSLNPYITNPHKIEPGMVLVFDPGSSRSVPSIGVQQGALSGFQRFGDDIEYNWLSQKKKLIQQGSYVNFADDGSEAVLQQAQAPPNEEYKKYTPPNVDLPVRLPDEYDRTGFDKNAKVQFNFKEGFSKNTFVSSNVVQDYGKLHSGVKEGIYFSKGDIVFIEFDKDIDVRPGDRFSAYNAGGKVSHKNSDRSGYQFSVVGHFKIVEENDSLWKAEIISTNDLVKRDDRITVYTPKIEKIQRTYNPQVIEAVIVKSYAKMQGTVSFGDIVYIDRGRSDGVEVGNVFEVFGFRDRATDKQITGRPAYKNGELTVITVTDDFATALVSNSIRDYGLGALAITKSPEDALREGQRRQRKVGQQITNDLALDETTDLNLDQVDKNIMDQAERIEISDENMRELERQERRKSIIDGQDQSLEALTRLEKELEEAEGILNETKTDEDKILENRDLETVELDSSSVEENELEALEAKNGKLYIDDELEEVDNPYGLTNPDVETMEELLDQEIQDAQEL